MPRPLVILIGVHRSLSTCLAECCQRLGLYLGEGRGGEDRELTWVCESIYPFPERERVIDRDAAVAMLRRWVRRHLRRAGDRLAGAKYPTLCFLAEELEEAAAAEGVECVWVDCARALPDSMRSLATRGEKLAHTWVGCSRLEAEALQIDLFRAKWAFLRSRPHHRVVADWLLRGPRQELAQLVEFLQSRGVPISDAQIDAAAASVNIEKAPHTTAAAARPWTDETTIIVKTHERPDELHDLLVSIRAYHPEAIVHVADDSRVPLVHHAADRYDTRPEDEGLSAGRNWLVAGCQTPYCLLCDDDMLWTEQTDIQALYDVLQRGGWDLVAGGVMRVTPFLAWRGRFELSGEVCRIAPGPVEIAPDGRPRYDLVDNFFLATTAALRRCPWDARLKVGEHLDWGFRSTFEAKLRCTCMPEVRILDRVARGTRTYSNHRARALKYRNESLGRWSRRLGFTFLQNDFHPPSSYEVPQ
jgi:hypothetical protein